MLTETGEGPNFVKLLDFGIAKLLSDSPTDPSLTGAGHMVGTPTYLAPEQVVGHGIDARTDVYAAGLLLYEMVWGTHPFRGADTREVVFKQLYERTPPFSSDIESRVPALVREAVFRATAKRPEERFQAAREMRLALTGASSTNEPEVTDRTRRGRERGCLAASARETPTTAAPGASRARGRTAADCGARGGCEASGGARADRDSGARAMRRHGGDLLGSCFAGWWRAAIDARCPGTTPSGSRRKGMRTSRGKFGLEQRRSA